MRLVDGSDHSLRQIVAKLGSANRTTNGESAELDQRLDCAHQVFERFGFTPLRPFDDAFERFVEKLIGHVRHHRFAQNRHEWRDDQCGGLRNRGDDVDHRIPEGPACLLVHRCGGNGNDLSVIEDLVQSGLVEVLPQIVGERLEPRLQIGALDRRFTPCRQRVAWLVGVPLDLRESTVQRAEESPPLIVVDESAEELLVILRTQLSCQFNHHFGR
ncbi:hypothetical protein PS624_05426 [Pseudomonas fluorescens]|uniref:Uncharacterized protein n=1 Tax=Pseudomonas fluorescens TaxID=294 RepID=A0A5E6XKL4_PSEFL|nr:hypothetical protein PS624_05426 [Pseudomonas fluorescens]